MKKKNKILKVLLIICVILFLMVTAAFVVTRMALDEEIEINAQNMAEMTANKKTVYVVSTEDGGGILHGEIIEEGKNVVPQTVYTGLEDYNYMTADDLGSTAIVDIYEGMTVMDNMVTSVEITTDTREYEMQVVNLMVDQMENDVVDIRIMFPDGSDFLVLPKKTVKNLNLENCVFWTYLNEEEILRMASATIDAYTITGTKIYTTRYVESNLQKEATPTYLVNAKIQDMMDSSTAYYDTNLLTKATSTLNMFARQSLEERLGMLSKEKLAAVAEGHELEDTAKNSVLTGLGGYEYEDSLGGTEGSTVSDVNAAMDDLTSMGSSEAEETDREAGLLNDEEEQSITTDTADTGDASQTVTGGDN